MNGVEPRLKTTRTERRCIHCLTAPALTRDHVLPRAWFPAGQPEAGEHWTAPCCAACNHRLGAIERRLGQVLGLCIDPASAGSALQVEKARRAVDPNAAKTPKDAQNRAQARAKLIQQLTLGPAIPTQGIYPGLGERWNRPKEEQVAVRIPKADLDALAEKIVRGICWYDGQTLIESNHAIDVYALATDNPLAQLFETPPDGVDLRHYHRPPVADIRRMIVVGPPRGEFFRIALWDGQMVMHASVLPNGF